MFVCLFTTWLLYVPLEEIDLDDLTDFTLEELLDVEVTVASNVITDAEKQPVSVTTITREQITMSGARTLNELIMIHVPGAFLVEDQDDVITGFRGFSPDNNSKVLMLLDGHNLNTEWFWGPSDALLNGLDLDYIEQVQVIRGPGSVTLGQGALLGVINIITRQGKGTGADLSLAHGQDGLLSGNLRASMEQDELKGSIYFADTSFDGELVRNEGWARDRFDQGRTVFQRNHHLKAAEGNLFLGRLAYKGFEATLLRTEQKRDLYNFFRDREEVEQELTAVFLGWSGDLGRRARLQIEGSLHQDDYQLFSHQGFVMGGTREQREGFTALLNLNELWPGNKLALGVEVKRFKSGRPNSADNSFIINAIDSRLEDVNNTRRWVFPKDTELLSFMAEDFWSINQRWDLFAAFRFDDHPDWGSQVTPRLGALYNPDIPARFRPTWQTGFRGAVGVHYAGGFEQDGLLREENFGLIEDNATLYANGDRNQPMVEPEEMSSLELAADFRFGDYLRLETVWFHNTMKNVIDVGVFFVGEELVGQQVGTDLAGDWGGFWFFKNNEGSIKQWGTETVLSYKRKQISAILSHALVRVDEADAGQFGGSMYIAGTPEDPRFKAYPENTTRLNLGWRPGARWQLAYNHLYYYNWYSPAGNKIDANHIASAAVEYRPLSRWTLSLAVKNLYDQDRLYPMNNNAGNEDLTDGTPALEGRTWWARARISF